jgi:hypothetical protein
MSTLAKPNTSKRNIWAVRILAALVILAFWNEHNFQIDSRPCGSSGIYSGGYTGRGHFASCAYRVVLPGSLPDPANRGFEDSSSHRVFGGEPS